jgi:hypothetical protein
MWRAMGASTGQDVGFASPRRGTPTFPAACRKNAGYATWVAAFGRRHGSRALASHIRRPCLEHPSSLLAQPAGVLALNGGEATAVWSLPARQDFEAGAQRYCGRGSAHVTAEVNWRGIPDLLVSPYPSALRFCMSDRFFFTSNIGSGSYPMALFLTLKAKGG